MPKIIENLEERLIQEARRQIAESGYGATTIRSVAKGCGVGVGTVYNYFPSKEALVATFMLSDWKQSMVVAQTVSNDSDSPEAVVRCLYDQLQLFVQLHRPILLDEAAVSGFSGSFSKYHGLLRSQLAGPLHKFCRTCYHAEFIAEALLTWTTAGKEFDEIYGMIGRLF